MGGTVALSQSTYWMWLCIRYSQLHTCIKLAFTGEPYNCGEGTEKDLTSMSCLIDERDICVPYLIDLCRPVGGNRILGGLSGEDFLLLF